jgi:hypothetical protein
VSVADLCRKEGFSSATFYNWRAKFGGMEATDAKRKAPIAGAPCSMAVSKQPMIRRAESFRNLAASA